METSRKNWWKYVVGLFLCLLFRLLPLRAPNLEPVLATAMPFAKFFGSWASVLFAVLSVLMYDTLTGTLGVWSLATLSAYGAIALFAGKYFSSHESTPMNYLRFAFFATIFFDATTGLTVGPLVFGQSFMSALLGQIPFTLLHLAGNMSFAYFLSPIIYKFIIKERVGAQHSVGALSLKQV